MNKFISISGISVIFAICLLSSCQKEDLSEEAEPPESAQQSETGFSVAEAKAFFETNETARTRSAEGTEAPDSLNLFPLKAGVIEPVWDSTMLYEDAVDSVLVSETPFRSDYEYKTACFDEWGEMRTVPLTWRLVIFQKAATDEMAECLCIHIPEETYADRWPVSRYDNARALAEHQDFSGYVIYATTDGMPLAATRFVNGQIQYGASMDNAQYTPKQNFEQLSSMLGWVYVVRSAAKTRVDTPPVQSLDEVLIVGPHNFTLDRARAAFQALSGAGLSNILAGSTGMLYGISGGGGNSSAAPPTTSDSDGDNIKTDQQSQELKDELKNTDCAGSALLGLLYGTDITIVTGDLGDQDLGKMAPELVPLEPPMVDYRYSITLSPNAGTYTLFEELFHVYQDQQWGSNSVPKLNFEVQAKELLFMYFQEHGMSLKDHEGLFGGKTGVNQFQLMNLFMIGGDTSSDAFDAAFEASADALRFGDYKNYPFLPTFENFDTILDITKDCDQYGEKK